MEKTSKSYKDMDQVFAFSFNAFFDIRKGLGKELFEVRFYRTDLQKSKMAG